MVLSRFDDYCLHQTPEPVRQPATSDRNAYDRYWFNGYAPDGTLYFAAAMARYPNRFVLDGAFTVSVDGTQSSFFASRRAPDDPAETAIGPYRVEVLDPMRVLRLTLGPNDSGITFDLRYSARTAPIEEARATLRREGMVYLDTTRFTQFGRWNGWIEVDGRRVELDGANVLGTRDRSWGVRPLGEPEQGRPRVSGTTTFWNWLPLQFDDCCLHAWHFEDAEGRTLQSECLQVPTYDDPSDVPLNEPAIRRYAGWGHRFTFVPGTRQIDGGVVEVRSPGGSTTPVTFSRPVLRAWPRGIGYGHAEWGHGFWKGEEAFGHERFTPDAVDLADPSWQLTHGVAAVRFGDRDGFGIIEQAYVGPHAGYGFEGLTGAPGAAG